MYIWIKASVWVGGLSSDAPLFVAPTTSLNADE